MFAQVVLFIYLATSISAVPLEFYGSHTYGHAAAPILHSAPTVSVSAAPIIHAAPAVVQAAPVIAVKAEPYDPNPQYNYKYGVSDHHTGDSKHAEETLVNGVVHGSYSLAEPDGTIRKVTYTADKINGFNAVVEKYGQAINAAPALVAHATPAVVAKSPLTVIGHAPPTYAPSVGYQGYHGIH